MRAPHQAWNSESMDRSRTYYDLFGVGRNASTLQIRAAYLRLLKTHHPDVAAQGDAGDFIRFINSAYRALSDPGRRAAYDAELTQRKRSAAQGVGAGLPAVRRRQWAPWLGWAAISIAGLAAVAAAIVTEERALEGADLIKERFGSFPPTAVGSGNMTAPLPNPSEILEHAQAGSLATPSSAVKHSKRCFADARGRESLTRADLCIVFDNAFLYSRNTPQADSSLPPRFSPLIVKLRHSSVLAEMRARESRLELLWEATFRALLTESRAGGPAADRNSDLIPTRHPTGIRHPKAVPRPKAVRKPR